MEDNKNILVEWNEDFEICPSIDKQHRKLIDIINRLFDALNRGKAREILNEIIFELKDYTVYHFSTEEKMFEEKNYVEKDIHKKQHEFFIKKVEEFEQRFKSEDIYLLFDVAHFIRDWICDHILISDKKYKHLCSEK